MSLTSIQEPCHPDDVSARLSWQRVSGLEMIFKLSRPGVVGGKHCGISVFLVEPTKISCSCEYIVMRIVGVGTKLILLPHLLIGSRHNLHNADSAGTRRNRLIFLQHGSPTTFHVHHCPNPCFRNAKAKRSCCDERIPSIHK